MKKDRVQPSVFTTTLLLCIVILFVFNFNFDVFKAGAAAGPVFGEGTPGRIARWLGTTFTLTLSFTATPSDGNVPIDINLQAVVGGTAPGTANYSLWWNCAHTGNSVSDVTNGIGGPACGALPAPSAGSCASSSTGYKCEAVDPSVFASVIHQYTSAGSYRAKAIVERATATPAEGSANISLNASIPAVSNMSVTVNNSRYCGSGVHATVSGTYTDPSGSGGNAYEILIDDDLVSNPNTSSSSMNPEWESGIVTTPIFNGDTFSRDTPLGGDLCNPIGKSDTRPQLLCQMTFNSPTGTGVYTAWARARNVSGNWSPWVQMSTYINGTNPPSAQTSWTTPPHRFPQPGFIFNPAVPSIGLPVRFSDTTSFAPSAINRSWSWTFAGGSPGSAPTQGPHDVTYATAGTWSVTLVAGDDAGSCSTAQDISVQSEIPQWREVAPR